MFYIHGKPEGSTVSRYDSLQQVKNTTGKIPQELQDAPPLGMELQDTWDAFNSLTEFSYTEISNFIALTGRDLEPWEVKAIVKLAKYREVTPTWPLK